MCLSGVCQPPTASLSLILGSLIHSRKAVICHIYILLPSPVIAYNLPSLWKEGQTCIHGECQMPVSHHRLTIGALIRNGKDVRLSMPRSVFPGGHQLRFEDDSNVPLLVTCFITLRKNDWLSCQSVFKPEPQGSGSVQRQTVACEVTS